MSTAYWFDSAPFTTYGEFNPTPLVTSTDSGHTTKQLQAGQEIRFASNSSSVGIYSYYSTAAGRTYVLLQGAQGTIANTQVGSVTIPATGSGAYQVFNLATGLDTTAVHEYRIVCITPVQPASGNWLDGYLELDTGTLAAVAHPNRFVWGMYGDSITAMTSAHQTDSGSAIITDCRYGDMWLATNVVNRGMFISGIAGGKVVNTGRDSTSNIPTNVDGVRVEYGTNDLQDLPTGNATFQQAYSDMIDNIRTRIGANKPIVCLQPFPRATPPSSLSNIATLIQAAIAGKSKVFYYGTTGWIDTDTSKMPDGIHPNAAGYAQLAPNEYAALGNGALTTTTLIVGSLSIG